MPADGVAAFSLDPLLSQLVPGRMATMLARPLERLLSVRRAARAYAKLPPAGSAAEFATRALEALDVRFAVRGTPEALPAAGGVIAIANQPFGGIEGLHLYAWLATRRPDLRVLGNHLLCRLPEFAPTSFGIDALGGRAAASQNAAMLRRAIHWVRDGGSLLVFPATQVSALDLVTRTVVDRTWHPSIARMITLAGAPIVPIFVDGSNSPFFHAAGFVHPRLQAALLARELFNKRGRVVPVTIGPSLSPRSLAAINGDGALTEYLRLRVYALACRDRPAPSAPSRAPPPPVLRAVPAPAPVTRVPTTRLGAEIDALPRAQRLCASGELEIWYGSATQLPGVLAELGRLRALGDRVAARDLEDFDAHYRHVFAWNKGSRELVGGCRIGAAQGLVAQYGLGGLQASTSFEIRPALIPSLGPTLDVGAAFVRADFPSGITAQLIWKGIAAYLTAHGAFRALLGTVTIGSSYAPASRDLLEAYLRAKHGDRKLARHVRARAPLLDTPATRRLRREAAGVGALEALEAVVLSIEADGKGVPVWLRQFLRLGARVLALGLDRSRADAIDVLVTVDLDAAAEDSLVRFLGRDGTALFRAPLTGESTGLVAGANAARSSGGSRRA